MKVTMIDFLHRHSEIQFEIQFEIQLCNLNWYLLAVRVGSAQKQKYINPR